MCKQLYFEYAVKISDSVYIIFTCSFITWLQHVSQRSANRGCWVSFRSEWLFAFSTLPTPGRSEVMFFIDAWMQFAGAAWRFIRMVAYCAKMLSQIDYWLAYGFIFNLIFRITISVYIHTYTSALIQSSKFRLRFNRGWYTTASYGMKAYSWCVCLY